MMFIVHASLVTIVIYDCNMFYNTGQATDKLYRFNETHLILSSYVATAISLTYFGATTISITTLDITTLSVTIHSALSII